MSDGEAGAPAQEPASPGTPSPAPETERVEPETPDTIDEGDGNEPEPELIDWDEGGKKYKIPKAVQPNLLRQSEFSRKMNALQEERTKFEAERESLPKWRESEEAHQRNLGQLHLLDDQLKAFDKVDWSAWLSHPDPNQRAKALAAQAQRYELDRKRGEIRKSIEDGKQKHEADANRAIEQRIQAAREFAAKEYPNWPEREKQINALIPTLNLSPRAAQALYANMEPGLIRVLVDAVEGQSARAARAKAAKEAAEEAANTVTPLATVASRSGSSSPGARKGPPEKMEDYIAWRKAGGGVKRA